MTGNGTLLTPLHALPPAAGTVAVATDGTTVTGNGTSGTPISLVDVNTTVGLSVKYGTIVAPTATVVPVTNAGGNATPWGTPKSPSNWNPATSVYTVSRTGLYDVNATVQWANPGGSPAGLRTLLLTLKLYECSMCPILPLLEYMHYRQHINT